MVCLRKIGINTLHKGDDVDNDYNNNSPNMWQILRSNLRNLQSRRGVALGGNAERVCYLASDTKSALLEKSLKIATILK